MAEIFLELVKNIIHRFVQEVQHFPSGTLSFLSLHIMLIYHNGPSEHQKIMKKNMRNLTYHGRRLQGNSKQPFLGGAGPVQCARGRGGKRGMNWIAASSNI